MNRWRHLGGATILAIVWSSGGTASAWDPFLVENAHVEDGNASLAEGNAAAALMHYDRAARELPDAPGVHLNRGLALLESGELERAREAFLLATEPPAPRELRADAYYDLGLAFYREGDAAAQAENTEEATRLFREAADAFRRSLRMRPGTENAGWNLELALRRILEQEQRQQEQEEQEQEEQEQQEQEEQEQQEQEEQEQQDQEQPEEGEEQQDPQEGEEGEQDPQEGEEPQDPEEGGEPQDQEPQDPQEGEEGQQQPGEDEEGGEEGEGEESEAPTEGQPDEHALPQEHRRVLDALQDGEDNLERHRARARALRENRRVEQDW